MSAFTKLRLSYSTGMVCLILLLSFGFKQKNTWSQSQINGADTGRDIALLNAEEKSIILYVNLARMYPQAFVENELNAYFGTDYDPECYKRSSYRKSLIEQLKAQKSRPALKFDRHLYELAKCFAAESGELGIVGHKRKRCPDENTGECCHYGVRQGKSIAIELLIDHGIRGVGHRENLLDPSFSKVGVSMHAHKTYKICAVIDLL